MPQAGSGPYIPVAWQLSRLDNAEGFFEDRFMLKVAAWAWSLLAQPPVLFAINSA